MAGGVFNTSDYDKMKTNMNKEMIQRLCIIYMHN